MHCSQCWSIETARIFLDYSERLTNWLVAKCPIIQSNDGLASVILKAVNASKRLRFSWTPWTYVDGFINRSVIIEWVPMCVSNFYMTPNSLASYWFLPPLFSFSMILYSCAVCSNEFQLTFHPCFISSMLGRVQRHIFYTFQGRRAVLSFPWTTLTASSIAFSNLLTRRNLFAKIWSSALRKDWERLGPHSSVGTFQNHQRLPQAFSRYSTGLNWICPLYLKIGQSAPRCF